MTSTKPKTKHYAWTLAQGQRLASRPSAIRRDLPRVQREWAGRRVAVRWLNVRGNAWRRNDERVTYGTLTADRGEHVVLTHDDGTTTRINYRRVDAMWDLTRTR